MLYGFLLDVLQDVNKAREYRGHGHQQSRAMLLDNFPNPLWPSRLGIGQHARACAQRHIHLKAKAKRKEQFGRQDRKSVGEGKSGSVGVESGGGRDSKKKKK